MAMKRVLILFLVFLVIEEQVLQKALAKDEFVRVNGVHLMLDGKPFYGNGFNTHWLMTSASNPYERSKVTKAFEQAVGCNLTIGRTMACSDGGSNPLQSSPGVYSENMFQVCFFCAQA